MFPNNGSARTLVQFRALPLATLNINYLGGAQQQLAPGEFGIPSIDEFGIPLARLVSGAPYPAPVTFPKNEWGVRDVRASNTQSTGTRPAVAGARHVCTSLSARYICSAGCAPANVQIVLRDGASGVGTALWGLQVGVAYANPFVDGDEWTLELGGLRLEGSVNTDMTFEFTAAGGVATRESLSFSGYTETV